MTQLDEISRSIGKLEAAEAEARRQRLELFRRLDDLAAAKQTVAALEKCVRELRPVVAELDKAHNRGKGILIGVALAGGGAGAGVRELVTWLGSLLK